MPHASTSDQSMTLAHRLADWTKTLEFDHLPVRAIEVAKLIVLDQLGLQILGATHSNVQPQLRLVEAMSALPESTICFVGSRTSAPYAAYVNGTFACSCEFDDCHSFAWHVGSYIVPTALALGQSVGASGRDVIVSIVAGAQIMALLGCGTRDNMIRAGWHGAKILGTFGATAVAGKLLKLSTLQLANAFGIAGSDAAGTMEYDNGGGEVKRMHAGSAGRNGCQAALLAQDGLTGPPTIMEGNRGIFRLFGNTDEVTAFEEHWNRFHIIDTSFRFYPVIGSACPPLDAVGRLRQSHGFSWEDIEEIRLGLMPFAVGHGASITRPTDAVSASFSTAFSIALKLIYGVNRPDDYMNPERWTDPKIISVIDKIFPYAAEFPADAPILSCFLDVRLKDGRVLSEYQQGFRGHPDCSETRDDDVGQKFFDNVDGIVDTEVAAKIIDTVASLDNFGNLDILAMLMAVGSRQS